MNIIVCIDKSGGMMFGGRRHSQDGVLREKIDENFLENAKDGDFCFVEDKCISSVAAEKFYIFNWNRKYPGDLFFSVDLKAEGFKKTGKEEFKGSSHDKITLEIYSR